MKVIQVFILKTFLLVEKPPFGEGASINRSLMFCGLNYQFWNFIMKIFVESIDRGIWDAIVNFDEFFRVSQCASAKEMWDILEVTHEGITDVKRARKHALIQEYEMFIMPKGETIANVQKRFTHIVNHLISLGKIFEREELNIKLLKCLGRSWQPKVTTISESKGFENLDYSLLVW